MDKLTIPKDSALESILRTCVTQVDRDQVIIAYELGRSAKTRTFVGESIQ